MCERREKAGRPNFWLWIGLPDARISIHSCADTGSAEQNSLKNRARKNFARYRYVTFQMAEVAVPRQMFADILSLIARLRAPPAPA